jgi:hypothetical protein
MAAAPRTTTNVLRFAQAEDVVGLLTGLRSKIIAMGVSVANLALGNTIQTHTSPATLESALERVQREQPKRA